MTLTDDWDSIIDPAELECFVGREEELNLFRREVRFAPPRHLVYYIAGQGGIGKSTLLNRYKEIAQSEGFLLADCDEQQRDIPVVLGHFAHQLSMQGVPFEGFDEKYKLYRQKMHEIENDPEAPQGVAALIGRAVVRASYMAVDLLPGVRKGLEYLPRETLETQASEWATYLAKKLKNKDEVLLLREPVSVMTPLFFEDLNDYVKTKKKQILLCFENFETTRQDLQEWLLRLREYKPSRDIRVAIAGRDLPGGRWDALRRVTLTINLDVFTDSEAEAFLNAYNIKDIDRRKEILEFSGRLPVLMSWLSIPEGQEVSSIVPTRDIVERFLRWISDPSLRQVALLAAIPRSFNIDILELLLGESAHHFDLQSAFDWLLTMPFVQQRLDGWQYHSVVRRMMLRYQRQRSPSTYQNLHNKMAGYYKNGSLV